MFEDHSWEAPVVSTRTRYGAMAVPDGRDLIGSFLIKYGEWAWHEVTFLASVLPDGARVLDVGAFVGTFALGLGLCRRLGALCAVEANFEVLPLLENNLRTNARCPTSVVSAIVTGRDSGARVATTNEGNLGATSFALSAEGEDASPSNARAITLSALRAEHGPFDLIKLDAEGMEAEILDEDRSYLQAGSAAIWIECNDDPSALRLAELVLSWHLPTWYFAFPSHNPDNFLAEPEPMLPWAYEAGLLIAPAVVPQLVPELAAHGCILLPVGSAEDFREALWRTPRWLPAEFAHADIVQLASAASRALRGQSREDFLSAGAGAEPIRQRLEAAEREHREAIAAANEARELAEQRLADSEGLALTRLAALAAERKRSELAEQQLADSAGLALTRLAALGAECERRARAAETQAASSERHAAALQMELDAIRATLMWHLATFLHQIVVQRPLLHALIRRARHAVRALRQSRSRRQKRS